MRFFRELDADSGYSGEDRHDECSSDKRLVGRWCYWGVGFQCACGGRCFECVIEGDGV
jgi:hypothetical protein